MMKKVFLPSIFLLMIGLVAFAGGNNLYEHFNTRLPSLDERAIIYYNAGFEDEYVGSKEQNQSLHNYFDSFDNEGVFGALAFPPSTVEGTSTAGWTDDGSIVRLNTASDSVGIGTTNPAEKLTVQNGNFRVSGNITMSGGTFTFGGLSGTSTLTVANSGRLGVGTTTPSATFSVQGAAAINGTTTTGGLSATSTFTENLEVSTASLKINTVPYKWPSSDGANLEVLQTNGSGSLSWVVNGGSSFTLLVATSTPIATSTMRITGLSSLTDLRAIISIPGSSNAISQIYFNTDDSINYGSKNTDDYANTRQTTSGSSIELEAAATTTQRFIIVDILNESPNRKKVIIRGNIGGVGNYYGVLTNGIGVWNNTAAPITSFNLFVTSGNTMNASTTVRIYGGNSD